MTSGAAKKWGNTARATSSQSLAALSMALSAAVEALSNLNLDAAEEEEEGSSDEEDQIEIITASGRESGGDSATVIGGSASSNVGDPAEIPAPISTILPENVAMAPAPAVLPIPVILPENVALAPDPAPLQMPGRALGLSATRDRWYTITRGTQTGVFQGWAIVQLLVIGVPASCYVKHSSEALARAAYAQALAMGNVQEI